MSREIKFRAWHEQDKEMVYFKNEKLVNDQYQMQHLAHLINGDYGNVLTQYTGADDNNGNNLYEGDIIKSKCYPFYSDAPELHDGKDDPVELNYLGVVGIDVDGVYYDLKVVSSRVSGRATGGNISDLETFEIIGNIYENPELLKANK